MGGDGSTLVDVRGASAAQRGRGSRRAVLVLLAVVVAAGASGLLGVHTSTVAQSRGGWSLQVDYPRVARAGLDVTLRATVGHVGGFDPEVPVTLLVTGRYFDIFETQGFHPQPDSETRDAEFLRLDFSAPATGTQLVVDYDAYIQPASQLGRRAEVVLVVEGVERARVAYRTTLLP